MNGRIITVKGVGNVSSKPDMIIISLTQETLARDYGNTMEKAAADLDEIRKSIARAGYDPTELKTSSFNVNTKYERIRDTQGNYQDQFKGYLCTHRLNFEFAYDMQELGKVLSEIAGCEAKPKFSIRFSVKDQDAMKERMLEDAVANAMSKANILAKATGVKLGEIMRIDYSWGEIEFYSPTSFDDCFDSGKKLKRMRDFRIEPEDVEVSDTVTVVWTIEK